MATPEEIKIRIIAKDETAKAMRSAKKEISGLTTAARYAASAIAAIGAAQVVSKFVEVNKTFQSLQMSLRTVTGSTNNARTAFDLIQRTATNMPFSVEELTRSFIKMKALGIEPTEEVLVSFANTASAMSKSFDQFAEAVADAITGEFERLKEFGIKAASEGNNVSFTFRGVTTTVAKNSKEILAYLKEIGEVEFAGAAVEQMDTLGGAFSNLGDSVDYFLTSFGELPAVKNALRELSDEIRNAGSALRELGRNPFAEAMNSQDINVIDDAIISLTQRIQDLTRQQNLPKASIEGMIRDMFGSSPAELEDLIREYESALNKLIMKRDELAGSQVMIPGITVVAETTSDWVKGATEGLKKYSNDALDITDEVEKATISAFKGMEDALVEFTTTGKLNFKSLANSILADILRIQIRQSVTGPISQALNNWMNPETPTAKAVGGPIKAGMPYMVGERGPEMIIPTQNGQVVPNSQLGGSPVNVTLNLSTGVSQTVRAEVANMLPQIAAATKAAVADARMRGGSYSSAMGV